MQLNFTIEEIKEMLLGFVNVFPHNTMNIPKEKASQQAYNACCIAYESHGAIRIPLWELQGFIDIGFNEHGIDNLLIEAAKLTLAVEDLISAYDSVKSNQHMNEYFKPQRAVLMECKRDILYAMFDLLEINGKKYNFFADRVLTAGRYTTIMQELKDKRSK